MFLLVELDSPVTDNFSQDSWFFSLSGAAKKQLYSPALLQLMLYKWIACPFSGNNSTFSLTGSRLLFVRRSQDRIVLKPNSGAES